MFELLDVIGTLVFAISGALTAIYKKLDLFGVYCIAFVTALGGGTVRDVLIGRTPVGWMLDIDYVYIITFGFFLSIIFNRDNVGEYPETFKVMRDLKNSGSSGYEPLRQFVSNRMSITEATTKQMAEFLTDIEMWCLKDGVKLTCPDDLKYLMEMS